jgi:DNA-binding IclR family transcriptional regulator
MPSPSARRAPTTSNVQVVQRAAAILRRLGNAPRGLSLAELATDVGLPRSTVHRLVKALEAEGFVRPVSSTAGFRLGPELLHLASASREWLVAQIHPDLVSLSDKLGETVDLAILSGDRVLFIDQVPRPQRLQAVSAVGVSFPVHSTANGKALLATLDDREVRRLLPSRLRRLTCHTITSLDVLLTELAEVRETGLAWDREENDIGICAVGAAVATPIGVAASLSVPVPASRFTGREASLARSLLATRRRVDKRLAS